MLDISAWKLYELFDAHTSNNGASWHAGSGAIFDLNSNALRPAGWTSADAAGLPIFPGLVRYEMTPVTGWLPHASYRSTQRWASADARHAGQLMRAAVTRDNVLLEAAVSVREAIAERYAESVIAPQFLAAIDG